MMKILKGMRPYAFYDENIERNASIRSTHLEDVFLEKTGRLDVRSLEGVLDGTD